MKEASMMQRLMWESKESVSQVQKLDKTFGVLYHAKASGNSINEYSLIITGETNWY